MDWWREPIHSVIVVKPITDIDSRDFNLFRVVGSNVVDPPTIENYILEDAYSKVRVF